MYVVYINTAFGKAFLAAEEWHGEQLYSMYLENAEQFLSEAAAWAISARLDGAWAAPVEEFQHEGHEVDG